MYGQCILGILCHVNMEVLNNGNHAIEQKYNFSIIIFVYINDRAWIQGQYTANLKQQPCNIQGIPGH